MKFEVAKGKSIFNAQLGSMESGNVLSDKAIAHLKSVVSNGISAFDILVKEGSLIEVGKAIESKPTVEDETSLIEESNLDEDKKPSENKKPSESKGKSFIQKKPLTNKDEVF